MVVGAFVLTSSLSRFYNSGLILIFLPVPSFLCFSQNVASPLSIFFEFLCRFMVHSPIYLPSYFSFTPRNPSFRPASTISYHRSVSEGGALIATRRGADLPADHSPGVFPGVLASKSSTSSIDSALLGKARGERAGSSASDGGGMWLARIEAGLR